MSIRIMSDVWTHSKHSGSELLVLLAISDYANEAGEAWPSIESLAKKARYSDRQVQRVLKALEASGELQIIDGAGKIRTEGGFQPTNLYLVKVVNTMSPPIDKGGDKNDTKGVVTMSPNPSLEPSYISSSKKKPVADIELVKEFNSLWEDRTGGFLSIGRIRKSLKNLLESYSQEDILVAWSKYLKSTDIPYLSLESFCSKIGGWIEQEESIDDYFKLRGD